MLIFGWFFSLKSVKPSKFTVGVPIVHKYIHTLAPCLRIACCAHSSVDVGGCWACSTLQWLLHAREYLWADENMFTCSNGVMINLVLLGVRSSISITYSTLWRPCPRWYTPDVTTIAFVAYCWLLAIRGTLTWLPHTHTWAGDVQQHTNNVRFRQRGTGVQSMHACRITIPLSGCCTATAHSHPTLPRPTSRTI